MVIYLFEFDDSEEALLELIEQRRQQRSPVKAARGRFEGPKSVDNCNFPLPTRASGAQNIRAAPAAWPHICIQRRGQINTFISGRAIDS